MKRKKLNLMKQQLPTKTGLYDNYDYRGDITQRFTSCVNMTYHPATIPRTFQNVPTFNTCFKEQTEASCISTGVTDKPDISKTVRRLHGSRKVIATMSAQ